MRSFERAKETNLSKDSTYIRVFHRQQLAERGIAVKLLRSPYPPSGNKGDLFTASQPQWI
jgi:hypothetical protein